MSSLLERLRHPDPELRRAACTEIPDDPAAALLLEPLAACLGDPVKAVTRAASDALVAVHRRTPGVDGVVRAALRSADARRRFGAAFTLARLEPPGPGLLPALVEALGSPDGDVRWAAARLLVQTGHLHPEVLTLLVGLVRAGESPMVRRMATFCLRELAPDRPEAADVLLQATRDDDLRVRRAALTAMAALMGPPREVGDRLLEALEHDADAASRRLAALALGELGSAWPAALPRGVGERLARTRDGAEDPDLRRAAERSLARLGNAAAR